MTPGPTPMRTSREASQAARSSSARSKINTGSRTHRPGPRIEAYAFFEELRGVCGRAGKSRRCRSNRPPEVFAPVLESDKAPTVVSGDRVA